MYAISDRNTSKTYLCGLAISIIKEIELQIQESGLDKQSKECTVTPTIRHGLYWSKFMKFDRLVIKCQRRLK